MIRFTFRYGALVVLLVFGILIGMNIAEKGIYRVVGDPDTPSQSFQVSKKEDGRVVVQVMGETYQSQENGRMGQAKKALNKEQKQTKEEEKQQITFISRLGEDLGLFFQNGAEKGLKMLAGLINE